MRASGGGPKYKAPCVRQARYEWFVGVRYAIDWTKTVSENRSRGRKHLDRFPRSLIIAKAHQLLQEHSYACLLHGVPAVGVTVDSHWLKRFEEEWGLSMRLANRKYQVPRIVVKVRMEIEWVNLFRVRYLIVLVFGYDPLILNCDQSPLHHNETGS